MILNWKIPSKSSTESEIIGLHDKSSDVLWTQYFLEAQGYTISSNIVYQDNMSTLSLAKNGYVSSSKRTKHIKAKYFFIRHYHHSKELDLRYCPTEQMWADVLTKPLQGSKFRQMRAFLMNCPIDYTEDFQFVPSDNPSMNPTHIPSSTTKKSSDFQPSLTPSLLPMKPRISSIALSSQGCVETPAYSHAQMRTHTHDVQSPLPLTPTTKTVVRVPPSVTQKVTWKDALFPRVLPTRVQCTPQ